MTTFKTLLAPSATVSVSIPPSLPKAVAMSTRDVSFAAPLKPRTAARSTGSLAENPKDSERMLAAALST
jgi:hypothetical protein